MATFKAFVVLLTFIISTISLPLSTTDSARVFCSASGPAAPTEVLMLAVHKFCSHKFPAANTATGISVSKTYDLSDGSTALISVDLDPTVTDLAARTCEVPLRTVVAECEIDGQSTGGQFNPFETGASLFTVKIGPATDSTESTHALTKRATAAECLPSRGATNTSTIAIGSALQAVQDFCDAADGVVFRENDDYHVNTDIFLRVYALRSLYLSKAVCVGIFDGLILECSDKERDEFTGGTYSDAFAHWTVAVSNANSTASSNSIDADARDSDVAERSSEVAVCSIKAGMRPNIPTVPTGWALQAVEDWCAYNDGKIIHAGQEFDNLVNWVVPNIFVSIRATKTMTVFKLGCGRSYEPILQACSIDWQFTGGWVDGPTAQFLIDVRNPETKRSIDLDAGDTYVVERSAEKHISNPFNATESTHGRFTTMCNSFPWSEDSVTIASDTVERAMDYMCFTLQWTALAKNEQKPLTFSDTNPHLFANVIALETVVLTINDCNFAYDTLFKACTWDGVYYGGAIKIGATKYVLELGPAGFNDPPAISAPKVSARDDTPPNSTTSNSTIGADDRAENQCYSELGYFSPKYYAMTAAWLLCSTIGTDDWEKGQTLALPLKDAAMGQSIGVKIECTIASGMSPQFCLNNFGDLVNDCWVESTFFGGTETYMGYIWTMKVLDKATHSSFDDFALVTRSLGASNCDDHGVYVSRVEAYKAAGLLCYEAGTVYWAAGDGITHLYKDSSPWITARVVTTQHLDNNIVACMANFAALIESCVSDSYFSGGTLEAQGAKWSLQLSPGSQGPSKAIASRDGPSAALPDMCDDGEAINSGWASAATLTTCADIVDTTIEKGTSQVRGYVYEDTIDVYVRITALETVTMTKSLCSEGFGFIITSCSDPENDSFYGNSGTRYLDIEWSVDLSGEGDPAFPPPPPTLRTIAARDSDMTVSIAARCDDGPPIDSLWAQAAASGICSKIAGSTLQAGDVKTKTFTFGQYHLITRVEALQTTFIDRNFCSVDGFGYIISECSTSGKFYGSPGFVTHGLYWSLTIGEDNKTESKTLTSRGDDPYSTPATCAPLADMNVDWYNALNAGIQLCRTLDGSTLQPGFQQVSGYDEGPFRVQTMFKSQRAGTLDYQTCIEMFDAAIRRCGQGRVTSGGALEWNGLAIWYLVVDPTNPPSVTKRTSQPNLSDTDTGHASNVAGRQSAGCLIAESTPIDKQVAIDVIGQFCPRYSSQTIANNDFVTATISAGGISIGLKVLATAGEGYILYPQYCYAGFIQLLNECSDGSADPNTKGGTLVTPSAMFTLSMAYV